MASRGLNYGRQSRGRAGVLRGGRRAPADYTTLLWNTNNLLKAAGIPAMKISTIKELTRVASSMFVAIYESLFHVRVEGIIRQPQTKEDYVSNVQRVIDGLAGQIQMDLQHIKGTSIVEGDPRALSNLIHIFIRIIAITGSQESQSTVEDAIFDEEKQQELGENNGNGQDVDSISTHESTFPPTTSANYGGPSLQKPAVMEAALNQMSASEVRKLCEQDARKLLLTTDVQLRQAERAEAARLRRATIMHARESRCEMANRRNEDTARRMQQKRWVEECERAAESYKERQDSESQTMLRQIYRGMVKKLYAWRRAERQEAKDNVSRMRDDAKNYIKSLQAAFEDRVKLMSVRTFDRRKDSGVRERAHRQQGSTFRRMYESDHQKALSVKQSLLAQKRQAQLLKENEGHRQLIALLAAEKWEHSLRA